MMLNLLIAFVSFLWDYPTEKPFRVYLPEEIEDVYDFEYEGLYYEFANENEVNLVRKRSVAVCLEAECCMYDDWEEAYNDVNNSCYNGQIVVPDSVEYEGKKYRVASVNAFALSYSKGLEAVTFTSDVAMEPGYYAKSCSLFFNQDLKQVAYHDSTMTVSFQMHWCPSLTQVHLPYRLNTLESSLVGTGMVEIDLDNHGAYNPATFSVTGCFDYSPHLKKVKFPECEVLSLRSCDFEECPEMRQIVFRPCRNITQYTNEILSKLHSQTETPVKVVSESVLPPAVTLIGSDFKAEYRAKAILYVPDEAIEDYRAAEYWQDFGEIRPMSQYLAEEAADINAPIVGNGIDEGITLKSNRSELYITTTSPMEVNVWSLQGLPVWSGNVVEEVALPLPCGTYIVTTPCMARKYRH
ncbi:MAG: hypothetical protein HDS08_06410 [Bacteroides sp.]|nr:hypothetical protein [Bacteroides sp.]